MNVHRIYWEIAERLDELCALVQGLAQILDNHGMKVN